MNPANWPFQGNALGLGMPSQNYPSSRAWCHNVLNVFRIAMTGKRCKRKCFLSPKYLDHWRQTPTLEEYFKVDTDFQTMPTIIWQVADLRTCFASSSKKQKLSTWATLSQLFRPFHHTERWHHIWCLISLVEGGNANQDSHQDCRSVGISLILDGCYKDKCTFLPSIMTNKTDVLSSTTLT